MAYRHECMCKYCKRYEGKSPTAKRMSIKLKRMARKLELRKIIVDEF